MSAVFLVPDLETALPHNVARLGDVRGRNPEHESHHRLRKESTSAFLIA